MLAIFVMALAATPWLPAQEAIGHSGQPEQSTDLPDAIVLVQPVGDEAAIAVTYSHDVPHAAARKSLVRLARLAGWKLGQIDIKDQELFGYKPSGERYSLGKQTGIEANATHVELTYGAAFRLQPFVEAYQDLSRLDLFFYTGGLASFSGLRSFDHPSVRVALVQDGGPYRYRVDIKKHSGTLPQLPLNEPPPVVQPYAPVQGTTHARALSYGPVVIISACAGLAAFAALRLLTALHLRGRSKSLSAGRRPLHDGPYIVTRRKD
jgi:hypothetical protein